MKSQPNRDYLSNDDIQTPPELARRLVEHFRPRGRILEPCRGEGNFYRELVRVAKSEARMLRGSDDRHRTAHRAIFPADHPSLRTSDHPPTPSSDPRLPPPVHGLPTHRPPIADSPSPASPSTVSPSPAHRLTATRVLWSEIKRQRDFFAWHTRVDWIVTNPPWSQFRPFLQHALTLADHIVYLVTINHLWTKARLRDLMVARFGVREIVLVDTPTNFPPLGFQLGAIYLQRSYLGPILLTDLRKPDDDHDHGRESRIPNAR